MTMKLVAAALCLSLLAAGLWVGLSLTAESIEEGKPGGEKPGGGKPGGSGRGCFLPPLPKEDVSLCRNLEVFYMEMGNISCKIVPKCNLYRQKITAWQAPIVKFHTALDGALYLLVMVDPDAPSRSNPVMKYWRHWLVSNITGADMKSGSIRGNVLSDYSPPTPPPETGLHRYQFFVYLQGDRDISLSVEEKADLGGWNLDKFLQQYGLRDPDTSTQFMTQFDEELSSEFGRINDDQEQFNQK
ncbi:phosphatidylethanolamine-binding protein 4 isoform a precursor [Mus musculus]|uniref:Phosphatidylethanolamine-binding protein 4 n=1 Tax=Mus musculus TaxID=10090 RepID=PEBP4_MOUSE|nr:phosphatidylethanolamine-binding protein 4 isoform a precursor [Mus musculus]Q9D9G2.2 RecName: Full=Phosphatidylethanolamine-binding protein 4; Short=PEBP-4; Flags: Precursor [Mus musculus]EDL35930.1 RIKEN cDNA 1700081D17, isoform CRA_b [Mus musculus]|eukprot:NP_082836.2 phosphatidylethanolamine-binding protein 4 isoform a precursor [Mus musculus]